MKKLQCLILNQIQIDSMLMPNWCDCRNSVFSNDLKDENHLIGLSLSTSFRMDSSSTDSSVWRKNQFSDDCLNRWSTALLLSAATCRKSGPDYFCFFFLLIAIQLEWCGWRRWWSIFFIICSIVSEMTNGE